MTPPNLHKTARKKASRQPSVAKARTSVAPLNDTPPQPGGPQRTAIDALFTHDASVRHAVTENLKAFRTEAEEASARVKKAFEGFHPIQLPQDELERRHFVARGADLSQAAGAVIEEGLARIKHSTANAKITLQNGGALKRLIKEKSSRASSGGATIALDPLLDVINRKQSALVFIGSDPAIALCKAELEAQKIIKDVETPPSNGGAALQERRPSTGDHTVAEFVRDAVKGQMQFAKAPEIQLEYLPSIPNTANTQDDQKRILDTFQLRPGPSDVTSYHDFNTLQIAFAHVWTQIFDGQVESLGKELYHEYVKLKRFTGVTDADIRVTTLNDLRRLMATVRALSQTAQDQIPPDIRGNGGTSNEPKSATDLEDLFGKVVLKGTLGAVLGPIGLFVDEIINAAVNAANNLGRKTQLKWTDFDGRPLQRPQDKIIARVAPDVAASGTVEVALVTPPGERWRSIEFQQYDRNIGDRPFFRAMTSNNSNDPKWQYSGGPANDGTPIVLRTSQLSGGLLEFGSQEGAPSEVKLGRYLLGDLSEVLKDRTRVTFDWIAG